MRRATITLPDDLEQELERFRGSQPAPPSLTALAEAALRRFLRSPHALDVEVSLIGRILRSRGELRRVLANYSVSNPRLFGSVARGEETAQSDVDLLVTVGEGVTLFDLARLRGDLELLLGVAVDVVSDANLQGEARDEILAEMITL